jgi:hypothetical protein
MARVGSPDSPPPTAPATSTTTTTTEPPRGLEVHCTYDDADLHISCGATGGSGGSSRWTSSLSSGWSGTDGYEYDLRWGESATSADVRLERCEGSACEIAISTVDLTRLPAGGCPADFAGWFTTFPLPDLSAIHEVGPPFRIVPDGYKGHGYFRVPPFGNQAEIRMPIAGTLFDGGRYIEAGEVQYLLSFRTECEGLWFRFDHVAEPVAAIIDLFTGEPGTGSGTVPIGPLELAEDDLVGTSFGTLADGNAFLDFGVYDEFARLPVPAHPAAGGLQAVCMYDFFSGEIAAYLRANEHPASVVEDGLCP